MKTYYLTGLYNRKISLENSERVFLPSLPPLNPPVLFEANSLKETKLLTNKHI